jgi:hypothetical protein
LYDAAQELIHLFVGVVRVFGGFPASRMVIDVSGGYKKCDDASQEKASHMNDR